MNAVREWTASTIVGDLNVVLDALESRSTSGETHGMTPIYHDDGSNLRIQPSKNGVVQILKVSTVTLFSCIMLRSFPVHIV